ncbi:MAG TPA: TonB family protein [Pyrinomonadaceae bacterium]
MFNNLIESSSHRKEYKRRGSFFLLTTASYAVMLIISGVASIYAYDARLEDQIYQEVVTMLPVPEPEPARPTTPENPSKPRPADNNKSTVPERAVPMVGVDRPEVPPKDVSVTPNKVLPLPPGGAIITGRDWNPPLPPGGNSSSGTGGTRIVQPPRVIIDDDLPPPPAQPPTNKVTRVSKDVLKSKAISLPKPIYPALAKQIRMQGTVNVQVLIDETGRVISAQPLEGPPLLIHEARRAALQARFSPTMIGDQPVKVSGVITYNFVLQ